MDIKRIDSYQDNRFSQKALNQHGCFLVDSVPYEVEIISDYEAVIRGADKAVYQKVIDAFRFYTPHITQFYEEEGSVITVYDPVKRLTIPLEQIQPSQFYVDQDKIVAISSFIHSSEDIIVQVIPYQGRFISLDGHTRLYYAVQRGWESVRAVEEEANTNDWVHGFAEEARKRNIYTPADMMLVGHEEYEVKWNQFCENYFAE